MSEPTSKVRWPWLLVAVLGLSGALLLPLARQPTHNASSHSAKPMGQATEPTLLLKPALRPVAPESEPIGQRKPAAVPEGPNKTISLEDQHPKAGRLGHGRYTNDTTGRTDGNGAFAAGPIGPPANKDEHATETKPATTPEQLRQQLPGRFALSAPSEMEVGRSEHVTVVAGIEQLRAMVTSDLQAVTGSATQTVSTKDLPLSRLLRVELRADSDADFEIRAFTQADQRLSTEQTTTWEWSVTPKTDGDKHLTVVISNLVDGQGLPIAVTIAHRKLHVSLSVTQRLRELAGTASSAGSALAGLVGTWLGLLRPLLQRRREEEGRLAAKTEPEAKSSDPPRPPSEKPTATTTPPPAAQSDPDPKA